MTDEELRQKYEAVVGGVVRELCPMLKQLAESGQLKDIQGVQDWYTNKFLQAILVAWGDCKLPEDGPFLESISESLSDLSEGMRGALCAMKDTFAAQIQLGVDRGMFPQADCVGRIHDAIKEMNPGGLPEFCKAELGLSDADGRGDPAPEAPRTHHTHTHTHTHMCAVFTCPRHW